MQISGLLASTNVYDDEPNAEEGEPNAEEGDIQRTEDEAMNWEYIQNLEKLIFNYPPTDLTNRHKIVHDTGSLEALLGVQPGSLGAMWDLPRTCVPRFRPRKTNENPRLECFDMDMIDACLKQSCSSKHEIEQIVKFLKMLSIQLASDYPNDKYYHFIPVFEASRMINDKDLRPIGRQFENRLEIHWLFQLRVIYHLIALRRVLLTKSKNLVGDMRKIKSYFIDELTTRVINIQKNIYDTILENEEKTFQISQANFIDFLAEINSMLNKYPEYQYSKTIVQSMMTDWSINDTKYPKALHEAYLKQLINNFWKEDPEALILRKHILDFQMSSLIANEPLLRIECAMEGLMTFTVRLIGESLKMRKIPNEEILEVLHQLILGLFPVNRSFVLCEMADKLGIDIFVFPCTFFRKSTFKLQYINSEVDTAPKYYMPSREMEIDVIIAIKTFGNDFILKTDPPQDLKRRQENALKHLLNDLMTLTGVDRDNSNVIEKITFEQSLTIIRDNRIQFTEVNDFFLELESLVSRVWHRKELKKYTRTIHQYIAEKKFQQMTIYRNVFLKSLLDISKLPNVNWNWAGEKLVDKYFPSVQTCLLKAWPLLSPEEQNYFLVDLASTYFPSIRTSILESWHLRSPEVQNDVLADLASRGALDVFIQDAIRYNVAEFLPPNICQSTKSRLSNDKNFSMQISVERLLEKLNKIEESELQTNDDHYSTTVYSHIKQVFYFGCMSVGFEFEPYRLNLFLRFKDKSKLKFLYIDWQDPGDQMKWFKKMVQYPGYLQGPQLPSLRLSKQQMIQIVQTKEMTTERAREIYNDPEIRLPSTTQFSTINISDLYLFKKIMEDKGCLVLDVVRDKSFGSDSKLIFVYVRHKNGKIFQYKHLPTSDKIAELVSTLERKIYT